jgi:hypothetical protein
MVAGDNRRDIFDVFYYLAGAARRDNFHHSHSHVPRGIQAGKIRKLVISFWLIPHTAG